MTEPHRTYDQQQDVESHAPYIKIWAWLLVLTILEYLYALWASTHTSFFLLVLGLMSLATIKATLVGMFFMHLKFEGRWVYIMLVPAAVLASVFVMALYPDIGMRRGPLPEELDEEQLSYALPAEPASCPGPVRNVS